MTRDNFEKSLTAFFRVYNEAKLGTVAKMLKAYGKKRGRLFTKLQQAYNAVPSFIDTDGSTKETKRK